MENIPGTSKPIPSVVVLGLASDYGCQIQLTNLDTQITKVLGRIDLQFWQLASSVSLPDTFDVAIIEGAVATEKHIETLHDIRNRAKIVVAMGSCAVTGGIPGIAKQNCVPEKPEECDISVIEQRVGISIDPMPISSVIKVDYLIPGCPISPEDFLNVLQNILRGIPAPVDEATLCGSCRLNDNQCFLKKQSLCLGLITRAGCNALCVSKGRPCMGCHGISTQANIEAARQYIQSQGIPVSNFDSALQIFNRNYLLDQQAEA